MTVVVASPMPRWEAALMVLVAFLALVVRFVPVEEWAKWRSWFIPYGQRTEHMDPDDSCDAGDPERDQPQDPE